MGSRSFSLSLIHILCLSHLLGLPLLFIFYLCIFSISLCLLFFFFNTRFFISLISFFCSALSFLISHHATRSPVAWTMNCISNLFLELSVIVSLPVLSIHAFIQETTGSADQWLNTSRFLLSFILSTRRTFSVLKLRTSKLKKERKKKKIEKEKKKNLDCNIPSPLT